jgi:hypothetical protein
MLGPVASSDGLRSAQPILRATRYALGWILVIGTNVLKPSDRREATKIRFTRNMGRIGAITTFLHSGVEGLEKTTPFHSEGVKADILRAVVVFLHATTEDFIRSSLPRPNKKFTFSSASDIEKALIKISIDPAQFKDLFPALTQMAKRRNQIVHHADLPDAQEEAVSPWKFADDWQLIHWHLTVVAFCHRLRRTTGSIGLVEERATQNVGKALIKNVEIANAMIALGSLPAKQQKDQLVKMAELVNDLKETLKLEVEMFLDADGKPIEGVADN